MKIISHHVVWERKSQRALWYFGGWRVIFLTVNSFTPLKNMVSILVPTNDVFASRENG